MSIQLQTPHLFPRWHLNKPPPGSSVELSREPMALKWASYMRHNLVVVIVLHVMLHKREHKDTYRAEVTFDFSPCIWNWVPWDAFSVAVLSLSLSGRWGFIINVKNGSSTVLSRYNKQHLLSRMLATCCILWGQSNQNLWASTCYFAVPH